MSVYSTDVVCGCGCGLPTPLARQTDTKRGHVRGLPLRFRVGHNQRLFKRTRVAHRVFYRPDHERATSAGGVYVHILVAEEALGHLLPSGAEVHHVDGNPENNERRNLVICQDKAYHKLLHVRARIVKAGGNPNTSKLCCDCGTVKLLDEFNRMTANKSTGRQSACRDCGRIRDVAKRARKAA